MSYSILATSQTPALIIYVLDVSQSMGEPLGAARRIDVVTKALGAALQRMVFLSTRGERISPRYRIAMYAYSDHVWDLLDGPKTVDQVASLGVPDLSVQQRTDTARAFAEVRKLLDRELPRCQHCPAPLVCHLTDGRYTGSDPEPIARAIMRMQVPDGHVLIENIFISDQVVAGPIDDPRRWPGILPSTPLVDDYAQKLRAMSSSLPDEYQREMRKSGYAIADDAVMLLPGTSPELVEMGFVMSTMTKPSVGIPTTGVDRYVDA
jgi:hypothetical protein